MPAPLLGLQLYSLRRETGLDAEGTLRRIRGLGYDYVEMAGTYGWSAPRWKEMLSESDLRVAGAHISLRELTEDLEAQIEFQSALGNHRYVVPYVPPELQTADGFASVAETMNRIAETLGKHQAKLYYHHHEFEFNPFGSTNGFEILSQKTNPELISFEIDTYWVERAGYDAANFIAQNETRIGMIHAKEFRRRDRTDQPAGEGDINFPAIVTRAKERDWPLIVEFEGEGALEASRKSASHLRRLLA